MSSYVVFWSKTLLKQITVYSITGKDEKENETIEYEGTKR